MLIADLAINTTIPLVVNVLSMNAALENLKKSDPRLFQKFVDALQEDLGVTEHLATFECPACHTKFDINTAPGNNSGERKIEIGSGEDSLLQLLLELARLKKVTTGKIHAEFNRAHAEKLKGVRAPQIRKMKTEWLRSQIAKFR
jgi:hypothetical protein